MIPALWCEARCDGMYDEGVRDCQETATGAFGVKPAIKAARKQGWVVREGEWLCRSCADRRAALEAAKRGAKK